MKLIKESINFERGQDPFKAMGVGVFRRQKFNDYEEIAEYIIKNLPLILGTKKIPKNIINTGDEAWFKDEYFFKIVDYIQECVIDVEPRTENAVCEYVHDYLLHKGYKKGMRESINFQRGQDPLKTMDVGNITLLKKIKAFFKSFGLARHFPENCYYLLDSENKRIGVGYYFGHDDYGEIAFYYAYFNDMDKILKDSKFPDRKELIGKDEEKIFESLNFKRGRDPLTSMGVGSTYYLDLTLKFFINISEECKPFDFSQHCYYIIDSNNTKIGALYERGSNNMFYAYFSDIENILQSSEKLENIKRIPYSDIEKMQHKRRFNESLNFERGRDPLTSMGIGIAAETYAQEMLDMEQDLIDKKNNKALPRKTQDAYNKNYKGWLDHTDAIWGKIREDYEKRGDDLSDFDIYVLIYKHFREKALDYKKHLTSLLVLKESVNFERGQDPFDAMQLGSKSPELFADSMVELESKLKDEEPVWDSWKSYTGNFWNDCGYLDYEDDRHGWAHCYKLNPKKSLLFKNELINKVLPDPYGWLEYNHH